MGVLMGISWERSQWQWSSATDTELRGGDSFSLKEHGIDIDILRGKKCEQ